MKKVFSALLVAASLALSGCGGGGSSDGAGGGGTEGGGTEAETTAPSNIAGSYDATWQGGGTDQFGTFTCSGTLTLKILQTSGALAVTASDNTREGDCGDEFEFTASGSYNPNTGAINISSVQGGSTLSLSGIATEQDGKISMSGQWSITDTASFVVLASGTWSAESR